MTKSVFEQYTGLREFLKNKAKEDSTYYGILGELESLESQIERAAAYLNGRVISFKEGSQYNMERYAQQSLRVKGYQLLEGYSEPQPLPKDLYMPTVKIA